MKLGLNTTEGSRPDTAEPDGASTHSDLLLFIYHAGLESESWMDTELIHKHTDLSSV